jgi:uncharacterized protein (TIGR02145 family)
MRVSSELAVSRTRHCWIVASLALSCVAVSCANARRPGSDAAVDAISSSRRMPDGKVWTTRNLNVDVGETYCYADTASNCRDYGRLYTWRAAEAACRSLGDGWRLPTNDDWLALANRVGGIRQTSPDTGRAAYKALIGGGSAGFDALLGGGRAPDGAQYARLDAHGFYWTASETGASTAWFYNFGKGQLSLGHHNDCKKTRAFSVRCVRR